MKIALDFDETYTVAPAFWDDFIRLAQEHGNAIYIVTIRHEELDRLKLEPHFNLHGVPVIYCDGRPKKEVVKEWGIHIDVWIDDRPEGILFGTNLNSEQLEAWRKKDIHRG